MKKIRVSVPPDIIEKAAQIILQSLEDAEVEWERLPQHQKSNFYTQWSKDPRIMTLLGSYVDNIRGYIKDDIVRIWQQQSREIEEIPERLEKLLPERLGIEIVDTVECKKSKTECRLLWRLKGSSFLIVTGGRAIAWRSLLVRTMEWDLESQRRLKGIVHERKPVLVLFRSSGDALGSHRDQVQVKQLAQRCGIELIILPPKQIQALENAALDMLPLFAEQENG